jgi:uncharacterized protein
VKRQESWAGWVFVFLLATAIVRVAAAQDAGEIVVERNVPATMRDGIRLQADIYRPKGDGKLPVVLARTPYGKGAAEAIGRFIAAHGYITVIQDCRGRFASEGAWYAFKNDDLDGYDAVEWAATIPGSDGRVVMWGGSYAAITQVLAAVTSPPHLVTITPWMVPSNFHEGVVYQGGALEKNLTDSWVGGVSADPVTQKPPADLHSVDFYRDWRLHPDYDQYWKLMTIDSRPEKILVPGLYLSGWYDVFISGALRNYESVSKHGNPAVQAKQRLIIGPWMHGMASSKSGDVDFGPAATPDPTIVFRWYDYILKGTSNEFNTGKPVKIFVMGKNVWRDEDAWPLARAQTTRYYLHSNGKANSVTGDGSLGPAAPKREANDQYVYDPADPVPTQGGGLCCGPKPEGGAFDQRSIEQRPDVLVYTSEPFKNDFEITGNIEVELYAHSSAVDTDLTVKVVDVRPDGYAQNLTDGILRLRYRNSMEKPELLKPGEVYKITVDAGPTSNVFLPGHRLRIEVSSSNGPRFDSNPNTGANSDQEKNPIKATNAILHDSDHPSAVLLPVIPQ